MNRQFNHAYSSMGRPSIPPEQLLKALLLQALYSVRSAHVLMENRHGLCVAANLDAAGQAAAAIDRLTRTHFIGCWKITQEVLLTLSAYHLVRLTRPEVCS